MNDREIEGKFLALYGDAAIQLATMESALIVILNQMVERVPHMASDLPLSKIIQKIEKLAVSHFSQNEDARHELLTIVREVEKLRPIRNSFVHGKWELNPDRLREGKVRCFNYRLNRQRKGSIKERLVFVEETVEEWTPARLRDLRRTAGILTLQLVKFQIETWGNEPPKATSVMSVPNRPNIGS